MAKPRFTIPVVSIAFLLCQISKVTEALKKPGPTQMALERYSPQDDDLKLYEDFVPYRSNRHDSFDWRILKEVLLTENDNIVFSPFSVKLVLALLLEAAAAETPTLKELTTILPNIKSIALSREYYGNIIKSLKEENKNYQLNLGTKMFVDKFIDKRQKYTSIVETYYDTIIETLNFTDLKTTATKINSWCANITKDHIKNIISPDDIANSVILLINAIYFEGLWRKPFIPKDTFDFIFFTNPSKHINVTYMSQVGNFFYFESGTTLNAKILRLPYKGKKFAMTIILPNTIGGLDEMIRELNGDILKRLQWLMTNSADVKLTLPKFKFQYNSHLKGILQSIGISEIFKNTASLPALARGEEVYNKLKVSNIIQKAGIIVDESGTKAFAATEVSIDNKFGAPSEEFLVNRPFIFFIEDETTGTIIFAGKVINPSKL